MVYRFLVLLLLIGHVSHAKENWIDLTGGIKIDIEKQKVQVPIKVVNLSGGLEFIITIGTDKDYESVFALKCSGKELHLALETVGFEPQGYLNIKEVNFKSPKQQISLSIGFKEQIKPISHYLLWNPEKPVEDLAFYFCGSYFRSYAKRKEYAADLDLNVVAAYPSKSTILGPLVDVANPYQDEKGAYLTPNKKVLPPIGTIGWLLIEKRSQ